MTYETVTVIFKYAREPQKEGIRITVSNEKTLFEITSEITQCTGRSGPFRDINDLHTGDVIIFADQVSSNHDTPPSRSQVLPASPIEQTAPAITKVLKDPFMQMVMNSPEMMKAIFDNNPQIQSLRRANPQINAILSDPKEMMDLMKNLSNPATAREMFKASDRALSNADAAIGGMDAIRSLYNDFNQVLDADDGETATGSLPNHPPIESKREIEENPFPRENGPRGGGDSPPDIPPTFTPWWMPCVNESSAANFLAPILPDLNHLDLSHLGDGCWPSIPPHSGGPVAPPRQTDENGIDMRVRYSNQIAALQSMGFSDVDEIIQALKHSNGIINGALDYLTRNS